MKKTMLLEIKFLIIIIKKDNFTMMKIIKIKINMIFSI